MTRAKMNDQRKPVPVWKMPYWLLIEVNVMRYSRRKADATIYIPVNVALRRPSRYIETVEDSKLWVQLTISGTTDNVRLFGTPRLP
jgi:hypothetical protein